MSVALAVISAAAALSGLPQLPERGLALETRAGVQLQTMSGRPLATLFGLDLATDKASSHGLIMRDRRGRLFLLDWAARRVRRVYERATPFPGCRLTDVRRLAELLACRRTIKLLGDDGELRVVARAPTRLPAGHWERAIFAPRGKALLAQWIAECEVPVAYLVVDGRLEKYDGESVALGWLPSGVPVIHFPNGPCAASGHARGIYAVPRGGKPRLIFRTPRFAQYAMWSG